MCCRHYKKAKNDWGVHMDEHGWVSLTSITNSGVFGRKTFTEEDRLLALEFNGKFGKHESKCVNSKINVAITQR